MPLHPLLVTERFSHRVIHGVVASELDLRVIAPHDLELVASLLSPRVLAMTERDRKLRACLK